MVLLKVKDIHPEMRNIELIAMVLEKGEKKEVQTRYGISSVSWATLKDETGTIRVNLWRSQIDKVKLGAEIRLVNAFAKVFGEKLELNVGADGKIEVPEHVGERM